MELLPDLPNSHIIKRIAIIQDADDCSESTFIRIKNILSDLHFPAPDNPIEPKAGIINGYQEVSMQVLALGIEGKGMLEDLCLGSVSDDPAIPCVESYFECLEQHYRESTLVPPKNRSKAKARVFIASRKESTLYIGLAAKEGYWNFESHSFNEIKELLRVLIGAPR